MKHRQIASDLRETLDAWILATLPRATAYARSLIRDHAAADDLVHECYVRILQKSEVYDIPRDGTKILFRSITNACINLVNARRRIVSFDAVDVQSETCLHDQTASPLEELLHRELADRVERGLQMLTVTQRAAIELKTLGYSLQEIAEALGTTANNAGVLIHRARQSLAEYLQTQTGEAS